MDYDKTYNIPFTGLSLGKHDFEYLIDDKFFDSFSYTDIQPVALKSKVTLNKKNTFMELKVHVDGEVTLICDLTGKSFKEPIEGQMELIVKFGETYNDDDDVILVIPHDSYQINVAQYIYETVLLTLPLKRVHPGVADGSIKSEALEQLKELEVRNHDYIDPRWDKLNELLTQKKPQNGTSKEKNL